ncbi:MAG: hypothetical protein OEY94_05125 [Alphaproteobacteria bacterium]|nr:hypothetical protein [Alphaproteobacteria bacterium]
MSKAVDPLLIKGVETEEGALEVLDELIKSTDDESSMAMGLIAKEHGGDVAEKAWKLLNDNKGKPGATKAIENIEKRFPKLKEQTTEQVAVGAPSLG